MTLFWKGAVMLGLAVAAVAAPAVPAQAQYYGGPVYRDGWRGDGGRWHNRRYRDDRRHWRHWRHSRSHYRPYRRHCWTEWRRSPYRHHHLVRVRICR